MSQQQIVIEVGKAVFDTGAPTNVLYGEKLIYDIYTALRDLHLTVGPGEISTAVRRRMNVRTISKRNCVPSAAP